MSSLPRLLTDAEAAAYLSLPVAEVKRLTLGRVQLGTTWRFDRRAIDAHLDALSGLAPQSAPSEDDPEAALDRFTATRANAARSA